MDSQSYGEYEKLRNWMESQLTEGLIEEVPVIDYYISAQLDERWFKCKGSLRMFGDLFRPMPFPWIWGTCKLIPTHQ